MNGRCDFPHVFFAKLTALLRDIPSSLVAIELLLVVAGVIGADAFATHWEIEARKQWLARAETEVAPVTDHANSWVLQALTLVRGDAK